MITQAGINLIKKWESLHDGDLSVIGLQPKLCPANIWTVGYGRALRDPITNQFLKGSKDKAQAYKMYPNLTEKEAELMLKEDLEIFSKKVKRLLIKNLTNNQFAALVSFTYNLGEGNLSTSTLLKKINSNPANSSIRYEFLKWNKAKGKVLKGLVLRRTEEANLYFTK